MRHAEAVPGDFDGSDHERALSPRGLEQCAKQRQRLLTAKINPDKILHSSARRTTQTATLVNPQPSTALITSPAMYNGHTGRRAQDYLKLAAELADPATRTLMLVGHNPTISELSMLLAGVVTVDAAMMTALSYFSPATFVWPAD
jgi:phosphohistidine phosphatase